MVKKSKAYDYIFFLNLYVNLILNIMKIINDMLIHNSDIYKYEDKCILGFVNILFKVYYINLLKKPSYLFPISKKYLISTSNLNFIKPTSPPYFNSFKLSL